MRPFAPVYRRSFYAMAVLAGTFYFSPLLARAAEKSSEPFPDEWFFSGAQRPAPLKALEGKPAAAISIDSWIGDEVVLEKCRGKVIVVDFWATWCGPCMAAIPHNIELVKTYGDKGLVFVGVHDSNGGWDKADGVVKDKGINYPVGVDKSGGASVKSFEVQFWPTYVAIDRAGLVRAAGLLPNRVDDVVKALLAEAAPEGVATAAAAFAPEFYYGGASRPKSLKDLEGRPAPRLNASEWIGKEVEADASEGHVVVLTFVSSALGMSLTELDKLQALEKDLSPQGAVFIGVCDGRGPWDKVQKHAKEKSLTMAVMNDKVETKPGEDGKPTPQSMTADAFGIQHFPATVILDRAGQVRAAGVKADKVKEIVEKLLGEPLKDDAAKPVDDAH